MTSGSHAGVVHQDVGAPEMTDGGFNQILPILGAGHVGPNSNQLASTFRKRKGQFLQEVLGACCRQNPGTLADSAFS
jgi:hypothetical protein